MSIINTIRLPGDTGAYFCYHTNPMSSTHKQASSTDQYLFSRFSQAINWNAFSYATYKAVFTVRTLFLYQHFTTADFSCWANITSVLFLILLFADCGFSKSIPRFMPAYAQQKHSAYHFIRTIIIFQALVLCLCTPFFYFAVSKCSDRTGIIFISTVIFVFAGIENTMRLIYHSYFRNKLFNLTQAAIVVAQVITDILLAVTITQSTYLLMAIMVSRLIANLLVIATSMSMLPLLYYDNTQYPKILDTSAQGKKFIQHSAVMWVSNGLKSLTERNFLIPFITVTTGPEAANIFKVANDIALLFYRTVVKTIGTSDTSLLSHIELSKGKQTLMHTAFKKLSIKITGLSIPLLGIIGFVAVIYHQVWSSNTFVFQACIIMAIGYMLESILLPYERVLEVKRQYWYLVCSYAIYAMLIVLLIYGYIVTSIGLLHMLMVIHSVRLVSLLFIAYHTRRLYALYLPMRFILVLACKTVALVSLAYMTCWYIYAYIVTYSVFIPYF